MQEELPSLSKHWLAALKELVALGFHFSESNLAIVLWQSAATLYIYLYHVTRDPNTLRCYPRFALFGINPFLINVRIRGTIETQSNYKTSPIKDHALLSLPHEYRSQLPFDGGAFYTNDTMEQARPHYKVRTPIS